MTRTEFYIKASIIFLTGATFVCFAETKESMIYNANWITATISAYFIWCDFAVMPDFCHRFLVKMLSREEANPTDHRAASGDVAGPDQESTRSGASGCSTAGESKP